MIEKELKHNKKEIVVRKLQKKRLISIALVSMVAFLCINDASAVRGVCLNDLPNYEATMYEHQDYEIVIEWPTVEESLGTIDLPIGSIIQVNYTVLEKSNSSILFFPIFMDEVSNLWDPVPTNMTLAPGESFEETFTVKQGTSSNLAYFAFSASVITENSNATIHWWYDVLKRAKVPAGGFIFATGSLTLITIIAFAIAKKKSVVKE